MVEIHVRITCKGEDPAEIARLLDDLEAKIRERLGHLVFGKDNERLEAVVWRLLRERKATLAVAESCTGGLVASRLTDIPGSSDYFERGVVSYSPTAKTELLGVPAEVIQTYGVVSLEVARAMAVGVRRMGGTTLGVATTGITGPAGGSPRSRWVWSASRWPGRAVRRGASSACTANGSRSNTGVRRWPWRCSADTCSASPWTRSRRTRNAEARDR